MLKNKKENIAVIFGGKSTEHDISIITGLQVLKNVDNEKFNVIPVYISKKGEMFIGNKLVSIETYANFDEKDKKLKKISFSPGKSICLNLKSKRIKAEYQIDCAILCCHGMNGEDGTLQGLLELCNIPYTSSCVLSSAISMDKIIMKDIFIANKIRTAKSIFFNKIDFILRPDLIIKDIEGKLAYPIFVKPANLGSSIGISKCHNKEELDDAIEIASSYDNRILVEKGLEATEVNCAVLGNLEYQILSKIEYPKTWGEFLNFDEKYLQRNKNSINAENEINEEKNKKNKLNNKIEKKVKEIARKVFKIFNCSGIVRIDFLVEKDTNKIFVNELNSIPGSLAFYLFKEQGFDFKTLLNRLIDIAKKEKIKKDKNKFLYQSPALINFCKNNKIKK